MPRMRWGRHRPQRGAGSFANVSMRLCFALVFLLSVIFPSIAAIAAPQAAARAFQIDCHRQNVHAGASLETAIPLPGPGSVSSPPGNMDHAFFGSCVCVLCFAPVSPGSFEDGQPIIIPPAYTAALLRFATGVSATSGLRKATNFATGPPPALRPRRSHSS